MQSWLLPEKCIGYSAVTFSEIGSSLRTARKNRRLSQAELAQSLGMSRATISGIENGTVGEIGVRKLLRLATALGLEFSVDARRGRPTLQELREQRRAANSGG
jgi:transcriptional regulator with XRE-family HTH domain